MVFILFIHLIKFFIAICFVIIVITIPVVAQRGHIGTGKTTDKMAASNNKKMNTVVQKKTVTFNVWEYRVSGNTLLSEEKIERTLMPFLGPDKPTKVVSNAADALEHLYKKNGYPAVFVDIPEQKVIAGVVRLQIKEGKIDRFRITGADYFTLSSIAKEVPSLQAGQSIHMPSVQADIQRLHSYTTDLQAVPILKAGKLPGTMEVDLRVKDRLPLHGSLELNNHYSGNTTKTRLEGSIAYDNLWQKFHRFKLTVQVSPENTSEVHVLVANYILPVNDGRNRLAMYVVKSGSNIAAVGGLSVIGKGNIYGVRYVVPIKNSTSWLHSITLGLDYKDVEDIVDFRGSGTLKTPIQYWVASTSYSATSLAEKSTMQYSAEINFGLRGVNGSQQFENKRFKANPDFIYFRGGIQRIDLLSHKINLKSNIKIQLSASPLISNEQFTAGGYLSVRGYLESQILGDRGVSAGIEILSPKLFHHDMGAYGIRLLAFIEGATTSIVEPLPGQISRNELASTGIGLRVTELKYLSLKMDFAYPLHDAGDVGSGTLVKKGDSRIVFSLGYAF